MVWRRNVGSVCITAEQVSADECAELDEAADRTDAENGDAAAAADEGEAAAGDEGAVSWYSSSFSLRASR